MLHFWRISQMAIQYLGMMQPERVQQIDVVNVIS